MATHYTPGNRGFFEALQDRQRARRERVNQIRGIGGLPEIEEPELTPWATAGGGVGIRLDMIGARRTPNTEEGREHLRYTTRHMIDFWQNRLWNPAAEVLAVRDQHQDNFQQQLYSSFFEPEVPKDNASATHLLTSGEFGTEPPLSPTRTWANAFPYTRLFEDEDDDFFTF